MRAVDEHDDAGVDGGAGDGAGKAAEEVAFEGGGAEGEKVVEDAAEKGVEGVAGGGGRRRSIPCWR